MSENEKATIKIFDADDRSLKILGELLSNDTSRKIIKFLISNESYTNAIATKLDIRISLVIHHLKKMEELGLVEITYKPIIRKGNDHRYFKITSALFVLPNQTKEDVQEKGILRSIFKDGVKFTSIGIAAFIVWINERRRSGISEFSDYVETGDVPDIGDMQNLVFPLIVIIIGLVIYIIKDKFNR